MQIIGGKHRKRKLFAPKSLQVRPTASQLRETVFNICQFQIEEASFLDLFAGSGAMGLEALSRGAAHATFVDCGRPALAAIKKNIAALGEEAHSTVLAGDVLTVLSRLDTQFDLIYIDPPYGKGEAQRVLEALDSRPLLAEGGIIFIEESDFEEPTLHTLKRLHMRQVGRATLLEYANQPQLQ